MTNTKKIIGGHNAKELKKEEENKTKSGETSVKKECNFQKKDRPMDEKCLSESVIYQATVTETEAGQKETYTGLTWGTFKPRYGGHKSSFKY